MPARPLVACLLMVVGLAGVSHAQAPPPGTSRVVLDVTAVDTRGVPVTALRPEDLSLRLDGKAHPIAGLTLVQHRESSAPLPAPYATNQITPGRTLAIAVDVTRLPASHTAAVTADLTTLLSALHAQDRIGVVALAATGGALDFTTRHDRLMDTPTLFAGRAPVTSSSKEAEAAAAASLAMLERLVTGLSIEPGLKTVVFVSAPMTMSKSLRQGMLRIKEAAARQRIQLLVAAPGSTGAAPPQGLSELAPVTTLAAVASHSATRYELEFAASSKEQDDKSHRVQVLSLRPDVRVTAPPAVVIPATDSTPEGLVALTDMLSQPRVFTDLPLRLQVYPVMDTERDRLRLLILGETMDPTRVLAWAEFALIAPSGAVTARWKVESAEAAIRPLMTAALVPAGPYRLRMAASELSGRRGTVDIEFDAQLTPAGAFALGPLMFGALANDAFVPVLQMAPDTTAIMAYAEVYGRAEATDTWTARFDITRTTNGDPILTTTGSVRSTPDAARRAAIGTLELAALPAGDYLVRAVVLRNGVEVGRVTQTMHKAGR
jgi:hypothetical protein